MKRPDRDTAARPAKDQPLCFLRSSSSRSFNVIERSLGLTSVQASSRDRKSTRLNSSHDQISYAVFCLKKKKRRGHRGFVLHQGSACPSVRCRLSKPFCMERTATQQSGNVHPDENRQSSPSRLARARQ